MGRHRVVLGFALAAVLGLAAACGPGEGPALEAEKAALLESTLPKAEFWVEVERKGRVLEEDRPLVKEIEAEAARAAAAASQLPPRESALADALRVNDEARQVLESARAEQARVEAEAVRREAALAGYEERRKAGRGS